ncbi:putative regulator of Ty1 transposition protein [Clavispora lusitaniae]|uniref:Regulator of Ty1 transposition protein n=1 Tax=Clavispora lusitaniae TaxID=36911 RepID=A0AA91Q549_CLALS|nr:putative regulator of Ty1 transposition protein [Clavispora lusitaniae]
MSPTNMNLFQGTRFLLLQEADTAESDLAEWRRLVASQGGSSHLAAASDARAIAQNDIDHIISQNSNFAAADEAADRMIPVTTAQWLADSADAGQKRNYRLYSPSPLPFMDKVVVCVADNIAEADREAIYTCVRAFGGQYLDALSRYTTHLVATDLSNGKSLVAASVRREEHDIQIVLPQWVYDSMREQRRLPEAPYLVAGMLERRGEKKEERKDTETDESNESEKSENEPNEHEKSEESEKSEKSENETEKTQRNESGQALALRGKTIGVGENWLSPPLQAAVEALIVRCGGALAPSDQADIVLSRHRSTRAAPRAQSASLLWLFDVARRRKYCAPKNLLHVPAPAQKIPEFARLRISVTGYSGDARHYLAQLLSGMGAEFTKTLDSRNDFLVCARAAGAKFHAAQNRWKVRVVNHLWVEECYAAWRYLEPARARYTKIGAGILGRKEKEKEENEEEKEEEKEEEEEQNEKATEEEENGSASLVVAVEANTAGESDEMQINTAKSDTPVVSEKAESDKESEEPIAISGHPDMSDHADKSNQLDHADKSDQLDHADKSDQLDHANKSDHSATQDLSVSQASISPAQRIIDVPSQSSPVRASRSAKQKASAKLHTDMEDLNQYTSMAKSVRKMRTYMEELEQSAKRRTASPEPPSKKVKTEKPKAEAKTKAEAKPKAEAKTKEPKKTSDVHVVAVMTGCEQDLSLARADIVRLAHAGISIVNDYSPKKHIDTIIAPRVLRTEKFLKSLSKARRIVHPSYVADVLKRLSAVELSWHDLSKEFNIDDYALDKVVSVKQINIELGFVGKENALQRLLRHENGLVFAGVSLNLSVNLNGGPDLIASILKEHGLVDFRAVKLNSPQKNWVQNADGATIVVAHKTKDKKFLSRIDNVMVVDWDWCVQSIFHGHMEDLKAFALK